METNEKYGVQTDYSESYDEEGPSNVNLSALLRIAKGQVTESQDLKEIANTVAKDVKTNYRKSIIRRAVHPALICSTPFVGGTTDNLNSFSLSTVSFNSNTLKEQEPPINRSLKSKKKNESKSQSSDLGELIEISDKEESLEGSEVQEESIKINECAGTSTCKKNVSNREKSKINITHEKTRNNISRCDESKINISHEKTKNNISLCHENNRQNPDQSKNIIRHHKTIIPSEPSSESVLSESYCRNEPKTEKKKYAECITRNVLKESSSDFAGPSISYLPDKTRKRKKKYIIDTTSGSASSSDLTNRFPRRINEKRRATEHHKVKVRRGTIVRRGKSRSSVRHISPYEDDPLDRRKSKKRYTIAIPQKRSRSQRMKSKSLPRKSIKYVIIDSNSEDEREHRKKHYGKNKKTQYVKVVNDFDESRDEAKLLRYRSVSRVSKKYARRALSSSSCTEEEYLEVIPESELDSSPYRRKSKIRDVLIREKSGRKRDYGVKKKNHLEKAPRLSRKDTFYLENDVKEKPIIDNRKESRTEAEGKNLIELPKYLGDIVKTMYNIQENREIKNTTNENSKGTDVITGESVISVASGIRFTPEKRQSLAEKSKTRKKIQHMARKPFKEETELIYAQRKRIRKPKMNKSMDGSKLLRVVDVLTARKTSIAVQTSLNKNDSLFPSGTDLIHLEDENEGREVRSEITPVDVSHRKSPSNDLRPIILQNDTLVKGTEDVVEEDRIGEIERISRSYKNVTPASSLHEVELANSIGNVNLHNSNEALDLRLVEVSRHEIASKKNDTEVKTRLKSHIPVKTKIPHVLQEKLDRTRETNMKIDVNSKNDGKHENSRIEWDQEEKLGQCSVKSSPKMSEKRLSNFEVPPVRPPRNKKNKLARLIFDEVDATDSGISSEPPSAKISNSTEPPERSVSTEKGTISAQAAVSSSSTETRPKRNSRKIEERSSVSGQVHEENASSRSESRRRTQGSLERLKTLENDEVSIDVIVHSSDVSEGKKTGGATESSGSEANFKKPKGKPKKAKKMTDGELECEVVENQSIGRGSKSLRENQPEIGVRKSSREKKTATHFWMLMKPDCYADFKTAPKSSKNTEESSVEKRSNSAVKKSGSKEAKGPKSNKKQEQKRIHVSINTREDVDNKVAEEEINENSESVEDDLVSEPPDLKSESTKINHNFAEPSTSGMQSERNKTEIEKKPKSNSAVIQDNVTTDSTCHSVEECPVKKKSKRRKKRPPLNCPSNKPAKKTKQVKNESKKEEKISEESVALKERTEDLQVDTLDVSSSAQKNEVPKRKLENPESQSKRIKGTEVGDDSDCDEDNRVESIEDIMWMFVNGEYTEMGKETTTYRKLTDKFGLLALAPRNFKSFVCDDHEQMFIRLEGSNSLKMGDLYTKEAPSPFIIEKGVPCEITNTSSKRVVFFHMLR